MYRASIFASHKSPTCFLMNLCVCHMVYILRTILVFTKCIVMQEGKYLHSFVNLKGNRQKNFRCITPCQPIFQIFELLFEKGFVYVRFHSTTITLLCISLEVFEIEINKLTFFPTSLFVFMYLCSL